MQYPSLILQKGEERRLLAGHLWVFSNEVDNKRSPIKQFTSGQIVRVESSNGRVLGLAYLNPHTLLCARMLTTDSKEQLDKQFFIHRIQNALSLRNHCYGQPFYRLIFGESDGLPGLVIERFNDIFVIQISTAGMENLKSFIVEALVELFNPKGIVFKNDNASRTIENLSLYVETAYGEIPETIVLEENQTKFIVPLIEGQKTGWFFDQFINRSALLPFIRNKKVLDIFSYIGAWGIQAASHHASHVTCMECSSLALSLVKQNAKLNRVENIIDTIETNAFEGLETLVQQKEKFDVIILDPPALIKSRKDVKTGMIGYLKLHKMVMQLMQEEGSFLFSTSCSMHLSQTELLNVIRSAGQETKKQLRIVQFLHQSPDHPVHPAIQETNYLKGFVVAG